MEKINFYLTGTTLKISPNKRFGTSVIYLRYAFRGVKFLHKQELPPPNIGPQKGILNEHLSPGSIFRLLWQFIGGNVSR